MVFHPLLVIYRQSLPLNRNHTHFRLHSLTSWKDDCRCLSFSVLIKERRRLKMFEMFVPRDEYKEGEGKRMSSGDERDFMFQFQFFQGGLLIRKSL